MMFWMPGCSDTQTMDNDGRRPFAARARKSTPDPLARSYSDARPIRTASIDFAPRHDDSSMAIKQLTEEQVRDWTLEQKDRWWLENVFKGNMPQLTIRSAATGFL